MFDKRKFFEWGGIAASVILVAFGITSIVLGVNGRSTVRDNLGAEAIVGSPDMTPSAIKQEAREAKLASSISLPTCNVAGQSINTGDEARCFAQYMRIHALEATGGFTYAQMGRFQAKPDAPQSALARGGGTDDAKYALMDPKTQQPVSNGLRNLWVTETALTTALNMSFFAERVALFSIAMGAMLLLTGIGFFVLTLGGALRRREQTEAASIVPRQAVATG